MRTPTKPKPRLRGVSTQITKARPKFRPPPSHQQLYNTSGSNPGLTELFLPKAGSNRC